MSTLAAPTCKVSLSVGCVSKRDTPMRSIVWKGQIFMIICPCMRIDALATAETSRLILAQKETEKIERRSCLRKGVSSVTTAGQRPTFLLSSINRFSLRAARIDATPGGAAITKKIINEVVSAEAHLAHAFQQGPQQLGPLPLDQHARRGKLSLGRAFARRCHYWVTFCVAI